MMARKKLPKKPVAVRRPAPMVAAGHRKNVRLDLLQLAIHAIANNRDGWRMETYRKAAILAEEQVEIANLRVQLQEVIEVLKSIARMRATLTERSSPLGWHIGLAAVEEAERFLKKNMEQPKPTRSKSRQ